MINKQSKAMNNEFIYEELGQTTEAQLKYTCSFNGGFYVKTKLELSGRGIRKSGSSAYHVTEKAMDKLKTQYSTCFLASL